MVMACSVMAQGLKQTMKIPVEQVPLAVKKAFEKDFGPIPGEGYWEALVLKTNEGSRTVVRPLQYSFNQRSKSRKVVVRFEPDGVVTFYTGMNKTSQEESADSIHTDQTRKIGK